MISANLYGSPFPPAPFGVLSCVVCQPTLSHMVGRFKKCDAMSTSGDKTVYR